MCGLTPPARLSKRSRFTAEQRRRILFVCEQPVEALMLAAGKDQVAASSLAARLRICCATTWQRGLRVTFGAWRLSNRGVPLAANSCAQPHGAALQAARNRAKLIAGARLRSRQTVGDNRWTPARLPPVQQIDTLCPEVRSNNSTAQGAQRSARLIFTAPRTPSC